MNLFCRLGLHAWGAWRPYREVTKYLVRDVLGRRRPDQDYELTRPMQRRCCTRCGLTERRPV